MKTLKQFNKKPVLAVLAISLVSSPVWAEWATVGLMTITNQMNQLIPQHAQDQANNINKTSQALSQNIDASTEALTAALKVAIKQKALASNQIVESNTRNTQTIASALQSLIQFNRMKDASWAYGANTGQGFKSCEVLAENQNTASAAKQTQINAADIATKTSQTGGKLVGSQEEVINERLTVHQKEFCTVSEAQAGICTLSKIPGGDTNAGLLFVPVEENSKASLARHYVRENILGVPDKALSSGAARTPAAQDYLVATNQKSAILAMPAYSLATIDAQNTRSFKDKDGKMVSANELMDQTIARYYGGAEAQNWQKSMAMQDPRGLLKESNIIGGVTVYLSFQNYKQSLREEALLSSLLLAKSIPVKQDLKSKYQSSTKVKLAQTMPLIQ